MKQVTIENVKARIAELGGRISLREEFELARLRQLLAALESRAVKPPGELSGETLLDVASRTDLVYSDCTGILEYTNINGCFVKITAPPDKVIRFRCSNKRIYMRLVEIDGKPSLTTNDIIKARSTSAGSGKP